MSGYWVEEPPEPEEELSPVPRDDTEGEDDAEGTMSMADTNAQEALERQTVELSADRLYSFNGDATLVDPITMCEEDPLPCGGDIEGTWVVAATCNAEREDRELLDLWGRSLMNLTAPVCSGSVRLLTMKWIGELEFGAGFAEDTRTREAIADIEIGAECLTATLEGNTTIEPSDSTCAALNGDTTSCIFTRGRCVCTSMDEIEGDSTGVFYPGEESVEVRNSQTRRSYDYCIEGERMIWWESSGVRRTGGMVLRRKPSQERALINPGEGGPVILPREELQGTPAEDAE